MKHLRWLLSLLPKVWRAPVLVGGALLILVFAWRTVDLITARSYNLKVKKGDTSVELTAPPPTPTSSVATVSTLR